MKYHDCVQIRDITKMKKNGPVAKPGTDQITTVLWLPIYFLFLSI